MDPSESRPKLFSWKTLIVTLLALVIAGPLSCRGWMRDLGSDPDLPSGGDTWEDRRGLLRNPTEPVLREVANGLHFRGALVVEAVENGQHDLWLVETSRFGTFTKRLTNTPADETEPVWSPDNNWVAYLSDGTGPGGQKGKVEVFARHVGDGRVVQLTNEPQIIWHGPLDWLMDNQGIIKPEIWETWIVLTGSPTSAPAGDLSASSIYHLPVNGPNRKPLLIKGTEGATGLVRPTSSIFNGAMYGTAGGMLALNVEQASDHFDFSQFKLPALVNQPDHARGLDLVPGAFGWTEGYYSEMIYLTRGEPPEGEVGFEVGLAWLKYNRMYSNESNGIIYDYGTIETRPRLTGRLGTLSGIVPMTHGKFLALQDGALDGSSSTGCLRLTFYNLYDDPVDQKRPALFPNLCLDALPEGFHSQNAVEEPNIKNQFAACWRVFSGRDSASGRGGGGITADGARETGDNKSTLYAALVFNDQRFLPLTQLRTVPAQISGEIVPGSMRIRQISHYDYDYQAMVTHLVDPQPAQPVQ